MARKITDLCQACGICLSECPMAAIQVGDPIYVIEAEACADCCACSDACPCDAIIEDDTAIDRRRDHLD